jgi:hypothetical protein
MTESTDAQEPTTTLNNIWSNWRDLVPRESFRASGALIHVRMSPRRHINEAVAEPFTLAPHATNASVGADGLLDVVDGPGTE